jgi:hypothetical protein
MKSTPYYRSVSSIVGFQAGGLTGSALATLGRAQPWREPARARETTSADASDEGAPSGDGALAASAEAAPIPEEPALGPAPKGRQD